MADQEATYSESGDVVTFLPPRANVDAIPQRRGHGGGEVLVQPHP